MNMSAGKHKEQMAGEVSDAGSGDGSLSVVPSKKKLLIGGVVVVVGVVAYKIFFDRDKDDGGSPARAVLNSVVSRCRNVSESLTTTKWMSTTKGLRKRSPLKRHRGRLPMLCTRTHRSSRVVNSGQTDRCGRRRRR